MEIQIYKRFYTGSWGEGFYSGARNILDIFKCPVLFLNHELL